MALAPAAQAVSMESTGPLIPKAPLTASARAWGGTSITRRGSAASPRMPAWYHLSPLSRPALQVPITTPQRSGAILPASAPELAIASSAAFSAKSMTGSR